MTQEPRDPFIGREPFGNDRKGIRGRGYLLKVRERMLERPVCLLKVRQKTCETMAQRAIKGEDGREGRKNQDLGYISNNHSDQLIQTEF